MENSLILVYVQCGLHLLPPRLNKAVFSRIAGDFVLETIMCLARGGSFTQVGLPGVLEETTPEFIKKDEWSPQSPDCNPLASERQSDQAGVEKTRSVCVGRRYQWNK